MKKGKFFCRTVYYPPLCSNKSWGNNVTYLSLSAALYHFEISIFVPAQSEPAILRESPSSNFVTRRDSFSLPKDDNHTVPDLGVSWVFQYCAYDLAGGFVLLRNSSAGNRTRFSDECIGPPDDVTTFGYLRFNRQLVSYTIVAHWITSTRACVYDLACGGNSLDKFRRSRVLKEYCARASSWVNSSQIWE